MINMSEGDNIQQIRCEENRLTTKILVVDDAPLVCAVITRLLAHAQYEVQAVHSGSAALDLLMHEVPDLILLDITMPAPDGLEVCSQLKQNPRTAIIPIVLLTGLDDVESSAQAARAGADDLLIKPFDQRQLLACVQSVLLKFTALSDRAVNDF